MPRVVRTTVCSSCLDKFPHKEMYTVGKSGNPAKPNDVGYYTMFCKKCTTKNKDAYVKIIAEPKTKKDAKNSKKD